MLNFSYALLLDKEGLNSIITTEFWVVTTHLHEFLGSQSESRGLVQLVLGNLISDGCSASTPKLSSLSKFTQDTVFVNCAV